MNGTMNPRQSFRSALPDIQARGSWSLEAQVRRDHGETVNLLRVRPPSSSMRRRRHRASVTTAHARSAMRTASASPREATAGAACPAARCASASASRSEHADQRHDAATRCLDDARTDAVPRPVISDDSRARPRVLTLVVVTREPRAADFRAARKMGKPSASPHSATISVRPSDASTARPLSGDTFSSPIFGVDRCGMTVEDVTGKSVGATTGATALWSASEAVTSRLHGEMT